MHGRTPPKPRQNPSRFKNKAGGPGQPHKKTMVRRVQTQARDGSTPTKVATFNKKDPPNAISQASPDKAGSTAPKVLRVHKNEPVYEVDDARASRVAAEADGHALYAKRLAEDLCPAQQRCRYSFSSEKVVTFCTSCQDGAAQIRCLAIRGKIGVAASKDFSKWRQCSMCSKPYEGIVRIALARACWATYADRETHDPCRVNALALAANEIFAAGEPAEAEPLHEALLDVVSSGPFPDSTLATAMGALAGCYDATGRSAEARLLREALAARQGAATG